MDLFGDRMKKYEAVSNIKLTEKLPIIVRLDGNSFSKLTESNELEKPYDIRFYDAMCQATKTVLEYCSGSMLGYTQSDEITILLRNDQNINTEAFLDNRLEKICSLIASSCSVNFSLSMTEKLKKPITAIFDCRVFILPPKEVNNAFLWRQKDAFKNCVSSVVYWGLRKSYTKQQVVKMLDGKTTEERQEIIFSKLDINMNNYPNKYKRGVCFKRTKTQIPIEQIVSKDIIEKFNKQGQMVDRNVWALDENIPLFNQDKSYIENLLCQD